VRAQVADPEPLWSRPDWEGWRREAPARLSEALPALRAALADAETRVSRGLREPRAERGRAELRAALAAGDGCAAASAAARLAGLGEGLTPAADDYLVGALYALHALRPGPEAAALAVAVAAEAAPRTTTLSAAWLRRAAAGEVAPAWERLLEALLRRGDQEAAIHGLIATGHTSGRAALEGFIAAASALLADAGGQPA